MEENEKEVEQVNEAAETVQTETANAADTGKKAKSKKPVILGAIGAVVIAACGGVGAFFGLDLNVPAAKEWVKDYEAVQTTAKERNKNILLAFTGTGWDGVSDGFEKDVMNDAEFIKKMGKKFELAQIDIPGGESDVSEEEMQKIFTYAMMYNLNTTPSFILVSPEGISYGVIECSQSMGLEAVIEAVENAENDYKALAKLKTDIEKASGVKKVQLIDELYEKSSDAEKTSPKMTDYILEVPALDPENQSGLVGKYKLLAAYSEAGLYMQRGDVKGARDVLLRMVEGSDVESEYTQEAYFTAAYISALGGLLTTQEEIDFTASLIEKAISINPEAETVDNMYSLLYYVKQQPPQSVELDE